jgi:hypothetical protein
MNDTQRVKIKADVMWAFLDRKNDMSDKYQVDLCNLSDGAVSALESMGLAVSQKEGKGYYITCKSKNPIRAYDKSGEELEGISIGNGSQAVALVSFYDWVFKNKEGRSPSLKKLVITELVSYDDGGEAPAISVDDDEIL